MAQGTFRTHCDHHGNMYAGELIFILIAGLLPWWSQTERDRFGQQAYPFKD